MKIEIVVRKEQLPDFYLPTPLPLYYPGRTVTFTRMVGVPDPPKPKQLLLPLDWPLSPMPKGDFVPAEEVCKCGHRVWKDSWWDDDPEHGGACIGTHFKCGYCGESWSE